MHISQVIAGLEELIRTSDEVYSTYASAKSTYDNLSEHKKTIVATLAAKSEAKSATQKESDAYASDHYSDYLKGLSGANSEYLQAMAKVKTLEVKLACYQSLNKLLTKELEINTNN